MKTTNALLTLAFVIVAFADHARAITPSVTPLLIIDDSNPDAVTFTYTDYNPFRSDSAHTFTQGIDLLNFFAPNTLGSDVFDTFGTLTTFLDGAPDYDASSSDNVTGDYQDLNIYAGFFDPLNGSTENFSTSSPAFTGTATIDLSDEAANLLPAGTIGDIYAGFSGELSKGLPEEEIVPNAQAIGGYITFLGDYEIIPEPSQWSLLLLGGAGLLVMRRLRAARAS
jgi:hypothetical protein